MVIQTDSFSPNLLYIRQDTQMKIPEFPGILAVHAVSLRTSLSLCKPNMFALPWTTHKSFTRAQLAPIRIHLLSVIPCM